MATMTVRFRGIFTVVLKEDSRTRQKSARILLPQGMNPRLAFGNDSQRIDPHLSYVAVPLGKSRSGPTIPAATVLGGDSYQPNLICPIRTDVHPDIKARMPLGRGFRREMISSEERLTSGLADTDGELYAVYFIPQHQIDFRGLTNRGRAGMTWNDDEIDTKVLDEGVRPSRDSMKWSADLAEFAPAIQLRPELIAGTGPDRGCAAFADFDTGEIVPLHNDVMMRAHVHSWRFMHSALPAREMPDGVDVFLPVDEKRGVEVVLRNRMTDDVLTIPIDPKDGMVLIGNETIDDLLRFTTVPSCSDPEYEFELNYALCQGDLSARPVPVCAQPDDDHRDPPELACSRYMAVRVTTGAEDSPTLDVRPNESVRRQGPIGLAVHLGINDYTKTGPPFARGDLRSAILDAEGFFALSQSRNFIPYSNGGVLKDVQVRNDVIVDVFREAKAMLRAGDTFLMTFDGFGFNAGRVRGWRLYRRWLSFDALFQLVSALPDGVRALIVSSACYSGTVTESEGENVVRELPQNLLGELWSMRGETSVDDGDFDLLTINDVTKRFSFRQSGRPVIAHLSACGPTQTIPDGTSSAHSPFVEKCLEVAYRGSRSFTVFESELQSLLRAHSRPRFDKRPAIGFPADWESLGPFLIG